MAACKARVLATDPSECSHDHLMFSEIGHGECACSPPGASYVCSENTQWEQNKEGHIVGRSRTIFVPGPQDTTDSLLLLGDSMLQFMYINPWSSVDKEFESGQLAARSDNLKCGVADAQNEPPHWHRRMLPGFIQGMPVVQLFGSNTCTLCDRSTYPINCGWRGAETCTQMLAATRDMAKTKTEVFNRIKLAQARNVLVMEGHFMRGWAAGSGGDSTKHDRFGMFGLAPEMDEALRNMLVYLGNNGAKHGGLGRRQGVRVCTKTNC